MVCRSAGREEEWPFPARRLVRRMVMGGSQDRPAGGADVGAVLTLARRAGGTVVPIVLAVVRVGVEAVVGVEASRAVGCLGGARPLDSGAAAEPVVRQAAVVAGPAPGCLLEGVEALLGRTPPDQRLTVL